MKILNYILILLFFIVVIDDNLSAQPQKEEDVVIENKNMKLTLSCDGYAKSLIYKPINEECLKQNVKLPFCSITQYRPYDNENFLMFPAKPRVFEANKIERIGDTLRVEFLDTYDILFINLNITDSYIGFNLKRRDYRIEDFGVKRKTEIDEIALVQLPVIKREHFGEWLNVMWDNKVAVNVIATSPTTRIDAFQHDEYTEMYAGVNHQVKLFNSGAAIIVSSKDQLLNCIDTLEHHYNMPLGVESRRNKEYPYSYYELRNVTTKNIDENIKYAKAGGFKTMVVYYVDFAKACGHFEWKDEYPNGMSDLCEITDKIRKAGMIPGLHFHYSKVAVNDPYINNGNPDSRINHVMDFTLQAEINDSTTEITVEENPEGVRMENGRRLLMLDNELITFKTYTTEYPYKFLGCERGVYNSKPSNHSKGSRAGHLDVDDWPLFLRINQNTGIQKEIAQRLGNIYTQAGFRFLYFDGAEDVPMPYWYNVSRSQLCVYNQLSQAPLFSEGALKSHYGWHILSRGNAFDIFPPERIRPAMKKYTLRCAKQIANDFTSVNFGWVNYVAPNQKTIGMQPDMFDYICSKALAWDCPISLVGNLQEIEQHPRTTDNLQVISMWEDAKIKCSFSQEQKEMLKDPDKDFIILKNAKGQYEFFECHHITADSETEIRAFWFRRNEKTCIVYWHIRGNGSLYVDFNKKDVVLKTYGGKKLSFLSQTNGITIPVADRNILEINMEATDAVEIFKFGLDARNVKNFRLVE